MRYINAAAAAAAAAATSSRDFLSVLTAFSRWNWVIYLSGTRMSPFWILLEPRVTEAVVTTGAISHAKLQSKCHHQQTNTPHSWMYMKIQHITRNVIQTACTTVAIVACSRVVHESIYVSSPAVRVPAVVGLAAHPRPPWHVDVGVDVHARTRTRSWVARSRTRQAYSAADAPCLTIFHCNTKCTSIITTSNGGHVILLNYELAIQTGMVLYKWHNSAKAAGASKLLLLTLNRSPGVHLDPTQVWWQLISVHQVAAPHHLR